MPSISSTTRLSAVVPTSRYAVTYCARSRFSRLLATCSMRLSWPSMIDGVVVLELRPLRTDVDARADGGQHRVVRQLHLDEPVDDRLRELAQVELGRDGPDRGERGVGLLHALRRSPRREPPFSDRSRSACSELDTGA